MASIFEDTPEAFFESIVSPKKPKKKKATKKSLAKKQPVKKKKKVQAKKQQPTNILDEIIAGAGREVSQAKKSVLDYFSNLSRIEAQQPQWERKYGRQALAGDIAAETASSIDDRLPLDFNYGRIPMAPKRQAFSKLAADVTAAEIGLIGAGTAGRFVPPQVWGALAAGNLGSKALKPKETLENIKERPISEGANILLDLAMMPALKSVMKTPANMAYLARKAAQGERMAKNVALAPVAPFGIGGTGRAGKAVKTAETAAKESLGLKDIKVSKGDIKKPIRQRVSEALGKAQTDYFTWFQPLENIGKGKGLKPSQDPGTLLKRWLGISRVATNKIDTELKPILSQVKDYDGLRKYLIAERANELSARGIGKSADRALEELRNSVGDREFSNYQKVSELIYNYQLNNFAKPLRDAGFLSEEGFKAMLDKNQKYISFAKVKEELEKQGVIEGMGKSINSAQQPVKRIKEGLTEESVFIDPIESLVRDTYRINNAVAKNKTMQALTNLGEDAGITLVKGKAEGKHTVSVFRDGVKEIYEVPKEIETAVKGMNEESLNWVVKAVSIPSRVLRATATSLNVGFAVPNVVRDQLSAAVNSKYGGIPIYDFLSGLFSVIGKTKSYQKWINSGADLAGFFSQERSMLQRTVKDITSGKAYKAGKYVKNPLELLRAVGEFSEKASRVGVYKRALKGAEGKLALQRLGLRSKPGLTGEEAMLDAMVQAREATVDFARRGSKMKAANAMIPFLNARTQGSLKLLQSARRRPLQTMLIGGSLCSAPAALLFAHNSQYPEYDEIPQYVKDTNFIIMTGDKDTPFIKIPKGEIGQIFANPVESFMQHVKDNDSADYADLAKTVLETVGENLSPVSNLGDIMPVGVKVPAEMTSNYDYFRGQNLYDPNQLVPELQFRKNTPETAKALGMKLGVSPAKIEKGVTGVTAGMGKQGFNLLDAILFGKEQPTQNLPVLDRFLGEQRDFTATTQKLYEEKTKAKQENARENYRIKQELIKGDMSSLEGLSKQKASSLINSVKNSAIGGALPSDRKFLYDLSKNERTKILKQNPELANRMIDGIADKDKIREAARAVVDTAIKENWSDPLVMEAIEALHPMYGLDEETVVNYTKSKTPEERQKFIDAIKYYEQTFMQTGGEQ